MKHKNELFILTEDIEKLNDRYIELHRKIKNATEISETHCNRMSEVLLEKYNFEIKELSLARKKEYYTQQAETEARNKEQTPWRRGWWWRLIFQTLTNRAQDIIEERAALEAEELFTNSENELDARAKTVYGDNVKTLSKRKRKKALKQFLKYKLLLEGEPAKPKEPENNVAPENVAEPVKLELKQPEPKEPAQAEPTESPAPREPNKNDKQKNTAEPDKLELKQPKPQELDNTPAETKPAKAPRPKPAQKAAPKAAEPTPNNNQLQGQMTLDDVQSPTPRADERENDKI